MLRTGELLAVVLSQFSIHDNQKSDHSHLCRSHRVYRAHFSRLLKELHLEAFGFRPYSLRRGGATFWFQRHGSFGRLLVQGRWQAAKTARVFLNEGLALLAELLLDHRFLNPFVNVCTNRHAAASCRSLSEHKVVRAGFQGALPFLFRPRMAIWPGKSKVRVPAQSSGLDVPWFGEGPKRILKSSWGALSPLRFGDREAGSGPKVQGALSEMIISVSNFCFF